MAAVNVITLFYTLSALADAPVFDISQTNGQKAAPSVPTEAGDISNVSTSMTPLKTVPKTPTGGKPVSASITSTVTDLPESQRLARLEQQINNITNMNLPQQLIGLQQELARISGQLQVQKHNLQLLNTQQCSFHQDLNQRITELKNLNSICTPNGSTSSKKYSGNAILGNGKIQFQYLNAYQAGLDLLTKKQYEPSRAAFQNYLDDYPNGNYAANAHYWIGEIYLRQKNIHKAAIEFQVVRDKFLKSEKTIDAKLKLAIIHTEMGKIAEAKRELMEIKKRHPASTVAQLASIRLQQLDSAAIRH